MLENQFPSPPHGSFSNYNWVEFKCINGHVSSIDDSYQSLLDNKLIAAWVLFDEPSSQSEPEPETQSEPESEPQSEPESVPEPEAEPEPEQ